MILSSVQDLPHQPQRIISLVPSQTELLAALGLHQETIGITKFCIYPYDWFNNKLRIGGTKALNIEKILELNPDLIIANKEENVKEQVELLANLCPVWVTHVDHYESALQMILDIGTLTGTEKKAEFIKAEIENKFNKWKTIKGLKENKKSAYLIWKDPLMTVGGDSFIHDMLGRAGFDNVFGHMDRYPEISLEQLMASRCEYLILSSEPYPFDRKHIAHFESLLPGVRVILADGEMFSWYGSRMLQAPDYFQRLWRDLTF